MPTFKAIDIISLVFLALRKFISMFVNKWNHAYSNYTNKAYCKYRNVSFDPNEVFFNGKVSMSFAKSSRVRFGKDLRLNSVGIDNTGYTKIVVLPNATFVIGDYSGMTTTVIQAYKEIIIGNQVNIGAGCMIFDTNFHSTSWLDRGDRIIDTTNAKSSPVHIGDYVFIGARSIICKGVTIGEKSIIAAGSVVVKNVPPLQIWGGNPATFIKSIE